MAEPILIMGESGTGKSTALRNLDPKKTIIIQPNAKSLPFPGGAVNYVKGKNLFYSNKLETLRATLKAISGTKPEVNVVVLEDFTHFFSARIFSQKFRSQTSGNAAFQRWNDFGGDVFDAIFKDATTLREDMYIVIIHHTEIKEDGTVGFKSAGKLLDNTIKFPSYFNYIFHSVTLDKEAGMQYKFQTNVGASRRAKSPYGAFPELYINNDLQPILKHITDFKQGKIKVEWK